MDTTDLNQLIRMAQVLKVRTRLLHTELVKAKRGDLAGSALNASDLAEDTEEKLICILQDILGS